jgi:hypothetical protein
MFLEFGVRDEYSKVGLIDSACDTLGGARKVCDVGMVFCLFRYT